MKGIIRTTVAGGVIGQYDHAWEVHRLRDVKDDTESYELYINGNHIVSVDSVVEALAVLVEQFTEDDE